MQARLPIAAIIRLREHKATKNKKAYDRKNKEWKRER